MSDNEMTDDKEVPTCLPYYHTNARSFPTSRPANKKTYSRKYITISIATNNTHGHTKFGMDKNCAVKQPTAATAFWDHF